MIVRLRKAFACILMMTSCAAFGADDAGAFFRAVQVDNDPVVRDLLRKGMDPNMRDPERRDPALVQAVREDAPRIVAVLLAAPKIDLEAQAPNGDTALMLAAYKGKTDIVRALIARGAYPNRPGWTALHYAASGGHADIVALLLEHHAYIDADSPNRTTPLMMAARDGREQCVKLLLAEGADSKLRNEAGLDAWDFAKAGNHVVTANMIGAHQRAGGR